jgi:hypothetical protein
VDEADDSLPVKAKAGGRASSVEIFCLDRQALVCLELASGLLVDTDVSLMGAAHARADGAVSEDHCTPAHVLGGAFSAGGVASAWTNAPR